VADQLTTGRRFRILTVVDDFTKESLATVSDTSITGRRLVAELDRIVERRGKPLSIVSDNGGEMTSRAVLQWTMETGIDWHSIARGKTMQSAFIDSSPAISATSFFCSRGFGVNLRCSIQAPVRGHASVPGRHLRAAGWG